MSSLRSQTPLYLNSVDKKILETWYFFESEEESTEKLFALVSQATGYDQSRIVEALYKQKLAEEMKP